MAEKVLKVGMDREDGFLYYIDKDGDIARVHNRFRIWNRR